jgi:hypothetical protein
MIREYFPTGFTSWTAFNEAQRVKANRKAKAREALANLKGPICVVAAVAITFGMLWIGAALDFLAQH